MSSDLKSNNHQNNFKAVKSSDSAVYEFEEFRLDGAKLMLCRNGNEISLTPKQVETLLALVERSGEIVGKDELMERLWANSFVEESNLNQNLYILRKTLGKTAGGEPMIETLRRRGYRFNGKLKENEQTQSETAPEEQPKEAAALLKFPSDVSDKAIAKKTDAVDSSGGNRNAAALAVVLLLAGAIALGYYFFSQKNAAVGDKKSIAVLPLKPIGAANRDEIYEVGIADSLIHRLSSMKEFVVRPLNATRKYADIAQDPIAAGREQQVDYVLASNYQLAGGKIRVTAQLFNVASGQIEETHKIEKEAGDLFKMQDQIAGEMGNKLLARFAVSSGNPKAVRGTNNEEAYRLYLQGRNLTARQGPTDLEKAVEYFEQAVRLDPNFARGYSGMAHAYILSSFRDGELPRVENEKAKEAVTEALELDNNLAEGYAVRGQLKLIYEWNLAGAEKDLATAIELEPNNDLAHWVYALLLAYRGRIDEAMLSIDAALTINPGSLFYQRTRGRFLYYARRYDEAIVQLKRVIELDENSASALGYLFLAYEMKGDYVGAYESLMKRQKLTNPDRIEVYQKAYETAGWLGVSRKLLVFDKLDEQKPASNPFAIARQYAVLGEKEQAFEYLNKAFEKHQSQMIQLNVEPTFDSLRDDPRFDELVRRVGLK